MKKTMKKVNLGILMRKSKRRMAGEILELSPQNGQRNRNKSLPKLVWADDIAGNLQNGAIILHIIFINILTGYISEARPYELNR